MIQLSFEDGYPVYVNPNHVVSVMDIRKESLGFNASIPCSAVALSDGSGWRVRGKAGEVARWVGVQ